MDWLLSAPKFKQTVVATSGKMAEICRKDGISDATYYNWKAKFGGMTVSEAQWSNPLGNHHCVASIDSITMPSKIAIGECSKVVSFVART